MKLNDFESLSIDELCVFREEVVTALAAKIIAERSVLENRLRQLTGQTHVDQIGKAPKRRSYPTVFPKYRNPNQPSETWAGSLRGSWMNVVCSMMSERLSVILKKNRNAATA